MSGRVRQIDTGLVRTVITLAGNEGWAWFVRLIAAVALTACIASVSASPARVEQLVQTALQLDHHPDRGATLYARHCSGCHGPEALGNSVRAIPVLAGQRRAYLIKQLADFSEHERESVQMHAAAAGQPDLTQPQSWVDIAAWLNSLTPAVFLETGDGEALELGEAIFQEQCASCHEEDARGDDDGFVPALRSQHYSYLMRQMGLFGSWHRRNVEPDLSRFLQSLDDDEMTAVCVYLSHMQGPVRDRTTLDQDGTVGD
ncbi:MAG TPA: c-type cytochrome [Povalibacter sp.]